MGRWANGEMGRWAGGQVGRWAGGQVGRWAGAQVGIVNAPVSCYVVKWRNRKVAIMGLVQLSNLISSYNGNKKYL